MKKLFLVAVLSALVSACSVGVGAGRRQLMVWALE